MGFPQRLVVPGEEVVLEAYPSRLVLVRPALVALVVLAGVVACLVEWGSAPLGVLYVLGAVTEIALLFFAGRVLRWRSQLFVVTTERVISRSGVTRRTGREIPLERIADVVYHQSFVERMLGTGSVVVEPAGSGEALSAFNLRRPAEVQSLINQVAGFAPRRDLVELRRPSLPMARRRPRPEAVPTDVTDRIAPIGGGGVLGENLRDLERLHERGILSDSEFASKRRQLLGM